MSGHREADQWVPINLFLISSAEPQSTPECTKKQMLKNLSHQILLCILHMNTVNCNNLKPNRPKMNTIAEQFNAKFLCFCIFYTPFQGKYICVIKAVLQYQPKFHLYW